MSNYAALVVQGLLADQECRTKVQSIISEYSDISSRASALRRLSEVMFKPDRGNPLNKVQGRILDEVLNRTHWGDVDTELCKHFSLIETYVDKTANSGKTRTWSHPSRTPHSKSESSTNNRPAKVIILDK